MARSRNITDKAADRIDAATGASGGGTVPGPSPDPATNFFVNDVIIRSAGLMALTTLEKLMLRGRYGRAMSKAAVENRSTMHSLAAYAVSRVATRSVPGAALVTTGLLAKTLFDRSKGRRAARRSGDAAMLNHADPDT